MKGLAGITSKGAERRSLPKPPFPCARIFADNLLAVKIQSELHNVFIIQKPY